jgi:hypothetical protein
MIQIKIPCEAIWNEMTPSNAGKFCGSCEKVVVDFSRMNDFQIKEYFTSHSKRKTCGRFLTTQIDRPLVAQHMSRNLWKSLPRFSVFNFFAVFFASSILWLSSCIKKDTVTGEAENNACEPTILGDTIVESSVIKDTTTIITEDTLHFISGEVSEPVRVKMGKIKVVDTISQKVVRKK